MFSKKCCHISYDMCYDINHKSQTAVDMRQCIYKFSPTVDVVKQSFWLKKKHNFCALRVRYYFAAINHSYFYLSCFIMSQFDESFCRILWRHFVMSFCDVIYGHFIFDAVDDVFRNRWRTLLSVDDLVDRVMQRLQVLPFSFQLFSSLTILCFIRENQGVLYYQGLFDRNRLTISHSRQIA